MVDPFQTSPLGTTALRVPKLGLGDVPSGRLAKSYTGDASARDHRTGVAGRHPVLRYGSFLWAWALRGIPWPSAARLPSP